MKRIIQESGERHENTVNETPSKQRLGAQFSEDFRHSLLEELLLQRTICDHVTVTADITVSHWKIASEVLLLKTLHLNNFKQARSFVFNFDQQWKLTKTWIIILVWTHCQNVWWPSVRSHGILAKIHGKFFASLAKIFPWSWQGYHGHARSCKG